MGITLGVLFRLRCPHVVSGPAVKLEIFIELIYAGVDDWGVLFRMEPKGSKGYLIGGGGRVAVRGIYWILERILFTIAYNFTKL